MGERNCTALDAAAASSTTLLSLSKTNIHPGRAKIPVTVATNCNPAVLLMLTVYNLSGSNPWGSAGYPPANPPPIGLENIGNYANQLNPSSMAGMVSIA